MSSTRNTAAAATLSVAAAAFLLLGPAHAAAVPDTSAPTGAVAGISDPARGTLELRLYASDAGWGLANAEATLGSQTDFARLGSAGCPEHPTSGSPEPAPGDCPASVSGVPLELDTTALPDGSHRLVVRVTDAAANTATLIDRTIAVRNTVPVTGPVARATIGVASGSSSSGGGKGKGKGKGKGRGKGKGPGAFPPCRWPRLRMRLIARPLWRTRPGKLPVLRFKKRHLYRGWLTCRVGGKRALAPAGTPVQVFYRIWRRSFRKRRGPIKVRKGQIRVRPNGRLAVRLGFLSGRTVIFRYFSPGGGVARSKLRIAIARTDPPRRGQ